jgi:hypothetical protein
VKKKRKKNNGAHRGNKVLSAAGGCGWVDVGVGARV